MSRDIFNRAFRIGVAGPVGCGKTTLIEAMTRRFGPSYSIGIITNDIYTKDDAVYLAGQGITTPDRIRGVETGDYPHVAIREDTTLNLEAIAILEESVPGVEIVFIESGGDNLAAFFSADLADITIFLLDVAGGDRTPRKGGPGMVRSDLLIINKIDLASRVGASLSAMETESRRVRGERPVIMTNMKSGEGMSALYTWLQSLLTARLGH